MPNTVSIDQLGERANPLAQMRVVLVRPRGAANIGATARAMKNMGLRQLTLVAPATRRPFAATAMAVHARDVLRQAHKVASIGEAVADCHLVVGTTCRGGPYRAAAEPLDAVAPQLVERAQHGTIAFLFGPEDHGLTNDDLKHCQRLVTIGCDGGYPSLNLAQAVLLCAYELRCAVAIEPPPAERRTAAAVGDVEFMLQRLQAALLAVGFLHRDNPDHIMLAVRQLFGRTTLDQREVRIFLGLARQIEWFAQAHRRPDPRRKLEGAA